jgi:hypothetical protein
MRRYVSTSVRRVILHFSSSSFRKSIRSPPDLLPSALCFVGRDRQKKPTGETSPPESAAACLPFKSGRALVVGMRLHRSRPRRREQSVQVRTGGSRVTRSSVTASSMMPQAVVERGSKSCSGAVVAIGLGMLC